MDLHPKCRARLKEAIQETLTHLEIEHGNFLRFSHFDKLAAKILPTSVQTEVQNWISETPIQDFIFGFIGEELRSRYVYDFSSNSKRLHELPEFGNLDELADRLIDEFQSLPWPYVFVFKMPLAVNDVTSAVLGDDWEIRPGLRLRSGSKLSAAALPLEIEKEGEWGLASLLSRPPWHGPVEWSANVYYLWGEYSGFLADSLKTEIVRDFEFVLRSFCGVALANEILMHQGPPSLVPKQLPIYVYQAGHDGSFNLKRSSLVSTNFSSEMECLRWKDLDLSCAEALFRYRVNELRLAFPPESGRGPIQLAGQWYFDSLCTADDLLSFVQVMVAIEILLGDKATAEAIGLGQLLANRCAYLIGKTNSDRTEILANFHKVYDIRSQIVHSGKNRLTQVERHGLFLARWMCRRVIQEELKLLAGDRFEAARSVIVKNDR
jgi:hypothetical protein